MILITIQVDAAEYAHELADHTAQRTIEETIRQRLADIPSVRNHTARSIHVKVERVDWFHPYLDKLTSWVPTIKVALTLITPLLVFIAALVAR